MVKRVVGREDGMVSGIFHVMEYGNMTRENLCHSDLMDPAWWLSCSRLWHNTSIAVPALGDWHGSEESFFGVASLFPQTGSALDFKRLESR